MCAELIQSLVLAIMRPILEVSGQQLHQWSSTLLVDLWLPKVLLSLAWFHQLLFSCLIKCICECLLFVVCIAVFGFEDPLFHCLPLQTKASSFRENPWWQVPLPGTLSSPPACKSKAAPSSAKTAPVSSKAASPSMRPSSPSTLPVEELDDVKEEEDLEEKEKEEGDENGIDDGEKGEEKGEESQAEPEKEEPEGEDEQKEDPEKMRQDKSEDLPQEKVKKRPHRRKPTPPSSESSMSPRMKRQDGSRFVHYLSLVLVLEVSA